MHAELFPMLFIVAGGILAIAFFAGSEIAIMSLDPLAAETEARAGSAIAKVLQRLRANPQRFLTTMLIGTNLASMGLATYFAAWSLSAFGEGHEGRATLFAAGVMTILQTMFAELLPKTVAAVNGIRTARLVALPAAFVQMIFTPLSWVLEVLLKPLIRLFTGGSHGMEAGVSRSEISTALALAQAGGQLHSMDAQVAREALQFSTRNLRDVMTPRVDAAAVPDTATLGDALELMAERGFSRLPVYRHDIDDIAGVLLLKDIMRRAIKDSEHGKDPADRWASEPVLPLMRSVLHFPDSKSVVEALAELRRASTHLAVVVDEHGGTAGIVTMEDILEELVGDIRDEYDSEQHVDVVRRTEQYAIVSGRARIEQLPELSGVDLSETDSSSVGGLLLERLGRRVVSGDELLLDGVKVTALKVVGNQIKLLKIEKLDATD